MLFSLSLIRITGFALSALFMVFMGMYQGDEFHITTLFKVPVSIILGIALGIISGIILV